MNKIKKVFISFSMFITGWISKVFAVDMPEDKYGVFEPTLTVGEKIDVIEQIAIPIILFIIGLFVILNKKIARKTKTIIIFILVIIGILNWELFNYFAIVLI